MKKLKNKNACLLFILAGFFLVNSCYTKTNKLPLSLTNAINKNRARNKQELAEVEINPKSKYYLKLEKNSIIKDSFEIINLGNVDFFIDYLNNSINKIHVLTKLDTIKSKTSKKIFFEFKIDNNFIESNQ
jgi:hypothetical protein